MSNVSVNAATPLAGGELFCGFVLAITAQAIFRYGIAFDLKNDHKRQIILNLICFAPGVSGIFGYWFNATKVSRVVSDITTMIVFLCVQYGLVILNHNTIIRTSILFHLSKDTRDKINTACLFLYLIPLVVLTPIYMAFFQTIPENVPVNTSWYNTDIYKPLNIALIASTEFFATITDIYLLRKVRRLRNVRLTESSHHSNQRVLGNCNPPSSMKTSSSVSDNLMMSYLITWFIMFVDIALKLLIAFGWPLLFDSIVTIFTIALRANVNLCYGLELKRPTSTSCLDNSRTSKRYSSRVITPV